MNYFHYKNNHLHCESTPLENISKKIGTPFYVYSYGALKEPFESMDKAFGDLEHLICYSMKANSNAAILKTFINLGSGIDVVTGGELYRALKAGCDPQKIVFSGVGKSEGEIKEALISGILQFNVESEAELELIQKIARDLNKKAPIALRVNPDVDPKTHPYIATGLKKSKFGIPHQEALSLYQKASQMSFIEIVGIDCHIGSQLTQTSPFVEALSRVKEIVSQLKKNGIELKNCDIGGGLGITYNQETPPRVEDYAKAVKGVVKNLNLQIILEPGRFLVGNAGALITQVLYNKQGEVNHFTIVDAASNDLMRPSLYDAYHEIKPIKQNEKPAMIETNVVGPICENGDFLAKDRKIQASKSGDLLALMSAGAYGFSMSSTYNSRPRCAEVMVKGSEWFIIREREIFQDLIKGEKIPEFLKSS